MNAKRRERISAVIQKLGEIKDEIETLRDEEQEAFESMPESLQQSDRGQSSESSVDALNQACNNLEGATTDLEGIE